MPGVLAPPAALGSPESLRFFTPTGDPHDRPHPAPQRPHGPRPRRLAGPGRRAGQPAAGIAAARGRAPDLPRHGSGPGPAAAGCGHGRPQHPRPRRAAQAAHLPPRCLRDTARAALRARGWLRDRRPRDPRRGVPHAVPRRGRRGGGGGIPARARAPVSRRRGRRGLRAAVAGHAYAGTARRSVTHRPGGRQRGGPAGCRRLPAHGRHDHAVCPGPDLSAGTAPQRAQRIDG